MLSLLISETAFIIGLVAFLGLILQRKPINFVIEGTIKAVIGYVILLFGAFLATQQLSQLAVLLERAFNVQGIMPNNEMIVGISQWFFGKTIGYIMLVGMIFHLLIARFTRFKYIFLTGHHILYMASLIAVIMAGSGLPFYLQIIIGSVVLACSMTFFPAICQPMMRQIIPNQNVAIGHFGSVGYVVSGFLGKVVGGSHKKPEINANQSTNLGLLNNPNVMIMLFMLTLFLFVGIIGGKQAFFEVSGQGNIIFNAFMQAFQFTAAIYIIIIGVRMMLTEVLTAFQGIADKLVPKAIPALDCPVIFPYAPIGVVIGFASSLAGGFAGIAILIYFNMQIVIPAMIAHFFSGSTAGVFGFVMGGYRGAIVGAFTHGLIITFLPLLILPVMYQLGYTQTTFSDTDFGVVGLLLYYLLEILT